MLSPSLPTSHKTRSHQVNVLMGHPGKGEPLSWMAVLRLYGLNHGQHRSCSGDKMYNLDKTMLIEIHLHKGP